MPSKRISYKVIVAVVEMTVATLCGADQWLDRFGLALVFEKCISILF